MQLRRWHQCQCYLSSLEVYFNWLVYRYAFICFLAILVVFPIALIYICCVMFIVNDSEVLDCGHEHTHLLSSFHFRWRKCSCSRRQPTVPKLVSIIILLHIYLSDSIYMTSLILMCIHRCSSSPAYQRALLGSTSGDMVLSNTGISPMLGNWKMGQARSHDRHRGTIAVCNARVEQSSVH